MSGSISPSGRSAPLVCHLIMIWRRSRERSFFRLGRNEDPPFTVRTMVVQAAWPGATLDETLQQVTERIERKLQETRSLDFLRSFTNAGGPRSSSIWTATRTRGHGDLVPRAEKIGDIHDTLPQASSGPTSTTSSATPSASSTGLPRTASRTASCGIMSSASALNCCRSRTCPRSSWSARRTSVFFWILDRAAGRPRYRPAR